MMIGQLVPLADVDNEWSLRFAQGGRRCIVAETWGAVWGLVVEDTVFAKVVASGFDRNWVASATASIAGPAVDPDAQAAAAGRPRPTASAKPKRAPVLDPDWDEIGIDEEPDLAFTLDPEPEPAYAWI